MTAPEARTNLAWRGRDVLRRHELLASGIFSGILGGIAMLGVALFAAAMQGLEPLLPLEIMGETLVGPEALDGAGKVVFGVLIHGVTCVALGVVFAALAPRELAPGSAMGLGVGFSLLAMGVMMTVLVPWANPGFRDGIQGMGGSWVIAHFAFGVLIGTAPGLRRSLSTEAAGTPAPRTSVTGAVEPL